MPQVVGQSVDELFAAPAASKKPSGPPKPVIGQSVDDLFKPKDTGPSLIDRIKPILGRIGDEGRKAASAGAEDIITTGRNWFQELSNYNNQAGAQSVEDLKKAGKDITTGGETRYGDPVIGHPVRGIGEGLMAVMSAIWNPIAAGVQATVVTPVQQSVSAVGKQVEKIAAPDRGQFAPTPGLDLSIHKSDVERQTGQINDFLETVIQQGAALVGGGEAAGPRPVKPLPKLPNDHPIVVAAERKVETSFDKLAVSSPEATTKVIDQVEKVSPPLAKQMKLRVKMKSQVKTPEAKEAVGAAAVKAHMEEPEEAPHIYDVVGADWNHLQNQMGPALEAKVGTTVPAHDMLKEMISSAEPGYVKTFLGKLQQHVENVPIQVKDGILTDKDGRQAPGAFGVYNWGGGEHHIQIQPSHMSIRVAAHEMVHAATSRFIQANPEHPLVQELGRLYKVAQDRMKTAVMQGSREAYYGLNNVHEFVAEAMTNHKFQEFLIRSERWKSSTEKLGNIWNSFVGIIQRMMGIKDPKEMQLLHNVMQTSQGIMEKQAKTSAKLSRGMSGASRELSESFSAHMEDPFTERSIRPSAVIGELGEWWNQLLRTRRWVAPESMGPEAGFTGSIVAKGIAERKQLNAKYWYEGAERRSQWNIHHEKIAGFMKGVFNPAVKFKDEMLQKAADNYRNWSRDLDRRAGVARIKYEPIDHWLPHAYSDAEAVQATLKYEYGSEWTKPGFMEKHPEVFDKLAAAGHKLGSTNPEDLMLIRQHAFDVAQMRANILQEMEHFGLAVRAEKGERLPPEFANSVTSPTGEKYWMHKNSEHIIKQAFDSKSLWAMQGLGGKMFRGAMLLKNAVIAAQLFLSAFHPLHIVGIHWAATVSRSMELGLTGNRSIAGMTADIVKSLSTDFISDPAFGGRIRRAYRGTLKPGEKLTAEEADALATLTEGGFAPEMDAQLKGQAVRNFQTAREKGQLRAVFHAPLAAMEWIQAPIFQVWIPNLKIASYLKDARAAIKMDPSLMMDNGARIQRLRQVAKSIDNRYGEMAYDTLFWSRFMKDIAVLNTLSLGWQMGFLREYGGGMLDVGQFAAKGGGMEAVKSGQLHRPLFLLAYNTGALAVGGLTTYVLTGKPPEKLIDYVYPKTGEKNPDGTDARVNTMYFTREFGSIDAHVRDQGLVEGLSHIAASKSSGMIGLATEWATNVNSFGQEISNPEDPAYKRLEEKLSYTLKGMEPISLKQTQGRSTKSKTLGVLGFTPAPKYATQTPTEGAIQETFSKYYAKRETSYQQAVRSADNKELKELQQKGDTSGFDAKLEEMQEKYKLTGGEVKRMAREMARGMTSSQQLFQHFDWDDQKRLLKKMPPEEREKYLPYVSKAHRGEDLE